MNRASLALLPRAAGGIAVGLVAGALAIAVAGGANPAFGAARPSWTAAPATTSAPAPTPAPAPAGALASSALTYADLVDLADRASSVVRVQVRKIVPVEPARAPGVRAGWVRIYVEARPLGLLSGPPLPADSLRYLVDVPLDAKGKPPRLPRLGKRGLVVFARTVADRPGELQLIAPDAQVPWDEALDARLKAVLTELLAPGAPGRIAGIHEAIFVPGNLAGEGETQLFLATADGEPASITVTRQPGKAPRWSVSFSEVVDSDAAPPARETLAWYRLACFLPAILPPGLNVSATDADRAQARVDYRLVRESLGTCPRSRD
ncbi:hypothetical protein ACFOD9_11590 [Novosphingobium bradum]|uniref:Uncharacterized protein n=1 Tax=Novosphingobium bradum TaxID=1737444 RepID=A0ABV7ISH3_9SPHN